MRFFVATVYLVILAVFPFPVMASGYEPVRLGMSAALTGPTAALGLSYLAGVRAGFAEVNEAGGVGGRKIQLVALDDGYDPDRVIHNYIRLVEEERVDQLFGFTGTPTVTRVLPLLVHGRSAASAMLFPLTGAYPLSLEPQASHIFSLRASYADEIDAVVERLVGVGVRRFAIAYQADAYGREGWHDLRQSLRRYGLDMVADAAFQRNGVLRVEDISVQSGILVDAHPEAVLCMGTDVSCAALACNLRNVGFVGPIIMPSFVVNRGFKDRFNALCPVTLPDNLLFCEVMPEYGASPADRAGDGASPSCALAAAFEAAMARYAVGAPAGDREAQPDGVHSGTVSSRAGKLDEVAFEGYIAARAAVLLFGEAAPRTDLEALRAAWTRLGGARGVFSRFCTQFQGHDEARPYVRFVTIEGADEKTVDDFERWRR